MIYLFLAEGFEEIEALTPIDVLRRVGLDVISVSVSGEYVTGAHGITVKADTVIEKIDKQNFDMVILPGGMPGADNLQKNKYVENILKFAYENDKYIAAICAAPKVLGTLGFLKGRNAVCFPGFENDLIGANVLNVPVCRDGNIITSKGIGTAMSFALELVSVLMDDAKADELKKNMQCWD